MEKIKKLGVLRISLIALVLFGVIITYNVGSNSATADVNGVAKTASQLSEDIETSEKRLEEVNLKVNDLNGEYNSLFDEYEELKDTVEAQQELIDILKEFESKEEEFKNSVSSLENDIEDRTGTLTTLENDIESRQSELDSIGEAIKLKNEEPVTLPAGQFIVGHDIEANRYTVKEGKSNFVVYSSSGSLKVNTILGGGSHGVSEYVFFAEDGDLIELSSSAKFYIIE